MKTKADIRKKMVKLIQKSNDYQEKYKNLNQIDMQSGEGAELLKEITKIDGALSAFKWILQK